MPRRTLRDRLTPPPARGREALYEPALSTTSTVDRLPSPVQQELISVPGWEESNKRVTFYCPTDLIDAIEDSMSRSGRSKTQVIVDALRKDLTP